MSVGWPYERCASWCRVIGLGVAIAMTSPAAQAQLLDQFISPMVFGEGAEPGVTVLSRSRPEYDFGGVRAGSFIVRPRLSEGIGYESNVLGTRRAVGSAVVQSSAAIAADSSWSRDSLRAEITVDDFRYLDQPNQSYTNWTALIGGRLDVGRDVVRLQYQHQDLNQTSRDLDVPQLDRALNFKVDTIQASYRLNLSRVSLIPGIDVSNYAYASGTSGGVAYRQDYRDRVVVTPSLVASYEFSPRRSAVLVVRDATASYRTAEPGMPRRDYNNPSILGGIDYDLTGLLRVRLLLGYEARLFSSAAYKTIQGPVIEASAIWTPTGLTTLTGTVSRRIQDTADDSTAAFTQTSLRLAVDHEYLRNVLLRGTAGISFGEYDRGGGNQTLYSAGVGATYLMNRYARLAATYEFQGRASDRAATLGSSGQSFGSSYNDHRILLQVRLAL